MTTLEAIAVLESSRRTLSLYSVPNSDLEKAMNIAIAALQKEQDKLDSAEDADYIPLE